MIGDPPGSSGRFGANPSFFDLVRSSGADPVPTPGADASAISAPHGTTVVALRFADGVVMAGDRRAVEGYAIADSKMDKVFPADDHSAVGVAGVAGQALELVRLFQTELEHYEKVEGESLSLEGKANRLAQMLRASFPLILQGLVVVPLYAGYDLRRGEGRIFRYDVIGGRYEETDFQATGSGSRDAKGSLKKRWRPGLDREEAVRAAVESLLDASEEDTATGGPDPVRGIFPTVHVITAEGVTEISEDQVRAAYEAVLERRRAG
ncbi:MAG TPA: proteasome subunit beta [Actinomycetota bacterium]|nr:proteasome subunit beta [Actinomycetota bacterium]